jgi:hypothetical protein
MRLPVLCQLHSTARISAEKHRFSKSRTVEKV